MKSTWGSRPFRIGMASLGFLGIAGAFLFTEHQAHALGALIYLPPFLCLFMHLFMHHGHGGHQHHPEDAVRGGAESTSAGTKGGSHDP